MIGHAELVIDAKALLGEGAHWDGQESKLHWVDIEGRQLRIYEPMGQGEDVYSFDSMVSAAVPAAGGGWILALQDGIYSFKKNGQPQLIAAVEPELPRNRLNDAKCDSAGRLWFGTMSMDSTPGAGNLYVMEPHGEVRHVLSDIGISNGLAWDDSRSLMYYIDTPTRGVDVMDYDLQSGTVSRRRTAFTLPEGAGGPDGMTIDREGMLWVAQWGGSCVSRWNPHTGKQIGKVEVPAKNVTSCTFGGEALDELYITTARSGMSEEDLQHWPLAGGLFKFKAGVQGMPANVFAGGVR
jgi:sugar lactone lactonase YvrE